MKYYEHFPIENFENIKNSLSEQYSFFCKGNSNIAKPVPWDPRSFPGLYEAIQNAFPDIQIKVKSCRLFLTAPKRVLKCHIDGKEFNENYWALNIPISVPDEEHYQQWIEYSGAIADYLDDAYSDYLMPVETDLKFFKLIDKVIIDRPYLVRIGVWHRVVNQTAQHRLILSLRFDQNTTEKLLDKFKIDYK